jgi:hypothetical protein
MSLDADRLPAWESDPIEKSQERFDRANDILYDTAFDFFNSPPGDKAKGRLQNRLEVARAVLKMSFGELMDSVVDTVEEQEEKLRLLHDINISTTLETLSSISTIAGLEVYPAAELKIEDLLKHEHSPRKINDDEWLSLTKELVKDSDINTTLILEGLMKQKVKRLAD